MTDGPLSIAGPVYGNVALWSVTSYLFTVGAVLLFGLRARTTIVALAATAAGLYYWFAADVVTRALDLAGAPTLVLRVVALALVGVWCARALQTTSHNGSESGAH